MRITHVAVRKGGKVYSLPKPNRHKDVRKHYNIEGGDSGFLINGDFHNRTEAGKVAMKNGQIKSMATPPYLHSEDLW